MHDQGLALAGAPIGRMTCIEQGTVLYRQHGRNAIGATPWGTASIVDRIRLRGAIRDSASFVAVSGRRSRRGEPKPSRAPRT
jgi:hypothetical protein